MGAKSTDQSYVFNMLNKDSKINGSIKAIIQNGKGIEPAQIEEQLMIISKRFKMPLKNKVLDYYKTGRIKLMTAPDPSKQLPSAMPFFLMKANGDIIAVVMVDIFGNVLQNGDISIDAKKLYVLMESAYMAIEYNTFANKYNTTVDELKRINNLTSNILSIGQVLKLPSDKVSDVEKEENTISYTVQKGDSLYSIARKYSTTIDKIKDLNNLTTNLLSIGQVLLIPTDTNLETTYTVQKGDSLYSIAKKYDTTVDRLKQLNNLKSNLLSIGQILIVR